MIEKIDATRPCKCETADVIKLLQDYRALKAKLNEVIDIVNKINQPVFVMPKDAKSGHNVVY